MRRICLLLLVALGYSAFAGDLVSKEDFSSTDIVVGPFYDRDYWIVPNNGAEGVDIANDYDDRGKHLSMQYDDATVYRTINASDSGSPDYMPVYVTITNDVVFDTYLQFTANDEFSVPVLDKDSKFAIWLYGEGETTNLYVTAGGNLATSDGYNSPTNYCLDASVEAGKWYRVTVRALRNVSTVENKNGNMMGFTVFIDETPVACTDADYLDMLPSFENPAPEVTYYVDKKRLFPSIVRAGSPTKSSKLAAAGFLGTGKADDIAIADAGDFDFAANPALFTISWDEGVTGFTFTTNDVDVAYVTETGVSSLVLDATGLASTDEIKVKDIHPSDWAVTPTYSVAVSVGALHIAATAPSVDAYLVDGETKVQSLAAAIEAVSNGGTIMPLRNVEENIGDNYLWVERSFTFDFAGYDVAISGADYLPIIYLGSGTVTIINSQAEGGVFDVTGANSLFQVDAGLAIIGDGGEGDAGVTIKGNLLYEGETYSNTRISAVKGFFTDANVANCVDGNSECSETVNDDGYWVVAPKADEPAEPPAYGSEGTDYGTEAAAAEVVQAGVVSWPDDDDLPEDSKTADNQAKYSALFTLSREGTVVRVELKTEGDEVEAVKAALTEGTQEILGGGESVEVSAVPGLYYGVSAGETLDAMEVKSWTIATGDKVEVAIPAKGENQTSGFYRLEASPSK